MAYGPSKKPRLTPDQAQALVEQVGTQAGAARHYGVPRSTFKHWLDPEFNRRRFRKAHAANLEAGRARIKDYYYNQTGREWNRRLLYKRRWKALDRMRKRNQRQAKEEI